MCRQRNNQNSTPQFLEKFDLEFFPKDRAQNSTPEARAGKCTVDPSSPSVAHDAWQAHGMTHMPPRRPHDDTLTWMSLWICSQENSTRTRDKRREELSACARPLFLCGWWANEVNNNQSHAPCAVLPDHPHPTHISNRTSNSACACVRPSKLEQKRPTRGTRALTRET